MNRFIRISAGLWAISLLSLLAICLAPASARADGFIIIHGAPAVPGHFAFAPLEVSYHHVTVDIDDPTATTTVEEEFYNPNGMALEGTYVFPLPPGAHIDKFAMDVDGKMQDAELLSADKARAIYEDTLRRSRDPALLEYIGRDAFRVRIFPIGPNGRKKVKLSYTELIKTDSGLSEYVYPLNTEKFSSRPLKDVTIKVNLNCKDTIKSLYSPSHNVDIKRDGEKRAVLGYEQRDVRPDTDFKLIYTHDNKDLGINLLTYRDGDDDGYFLLLASPGVTADADKIQAKDIVLVLDTSGSMAGEKIEQARKALSFCVNSLDTRDRFEIIRFSTETEPLFHDELRPANKENVDKALKFVGNLRASGATAIDDALHEALKLRTSRTGADADRPFEVIFLTDGMPTIGEQNEDKIVANTVEWGQGKAPIFCFGIGTDVNTHLLDRIADQTHAASQYVLPQEDIELKLSNFYDKIRQPALSNVDVSFNGAGGSDIRAHEIYPKAMPDLFKGQMLVVFGRYTGHGPGAVKITGTFNGARKEFAADVNFSDSDAKNAFIPQLWAARRVGWLLDEIRLHGESAELKDEVTKLARKFGIVTPYTAYLIIEDERKRNVPELGRNMREMEQDKAVENRSKMYYQSEIEEAASVDRRAGGQAVANARNIETLKDMQNMDQAQKAQQSADEPMTLAGGALAKSPQAAPFGIGPGVGNGASPSRGRAFTDAAPAFPPPATQPQGYRQANNYSQQARVVNGRAFYQNAATWTDSTIQANATAPRKRIAIDSAEYFDLIQKYPNAVQWLSLGSDLDVMLDGTIYEIRADVKM